MTRMKSRELHPYSDILPILWFVPIAKIFSDAQMA